MTPLNPPAFEFSPGWSDFTSDWWTKRIPQWEEFVKPIMKERTNIRILELGSYEGRSALYMLQNLLSHDQNGKLYCLDHWPRFEVEQRFDRNIACSGHSPKVIKMKGDAFALLKELPRHLIFDAVYIDADHTAPAALTQAAMLWPQLRLGGVMVFDDYPWKSPTPTKELPPKPGIDAFLECWKGRYKLLHKGWQVILLKIA